MALEMLFSPIRIGDMELKNRIAMAPITTNWAPADGTIPDRIIDYLEARARGGAGLIILETVTVDENFPYIINSLGLWSDELIPSFRKLADRLHAHGAKLAPQISHPGPESFSILKGIQPVGPSPTLGKYHGQICRELASEEIQQIAEQYGDAARRAREAGCDAMELHAAHRYMLAGSFLSPLRNKRTDAYGGTADGRLKFVLEIMESIRAKAGPDFPVIVRISGDEYLPGGRDLEETQYLAPKLVEAGVDALEISGGVQPELFWRIIPPTGTPLGINVAAAAAVKQVVDIPIITVGRIANPRLAEHVLQSGQADMVAMGRALLADPELPNKAAEGRFDDIAPCTGCTCGCVHRQMQVQPGGPGGMEAARVAAIRGHRVTLVEKDATLGGQLRLACVPPTTQELGLWVRYLSGQLEKAGVEVRMNTEATPALIQEMKPDVVIVASGGEELAPSIPGAEGARVTSAGAVLGGKKAILNGKVLVIGGGMIGCHVADLLADRGDERSGAGVEVTIVDMLEDISPDMPALPRMLLMPRLREKGVRAITSAVVKEITEDEVLIEKGGQPEALGRFDHIVTACGTKSVDHLSGEIQDPHPEVYVIGDAKQPRTALEAIAEAAEVARAI
jgi:NAD(H)-dependent 7beta-hydroxy-3-oxo-delta4-cholenoic acid oxidoreductase